MRPWCLEIGISSWEGLAGPFSPEIQGELALAKWAPEYRLEAWSRALLELGVPDRDLAEKISSTFTAGKISRYAPFPEAKSVMAALRGQYRRGILTNGASTIQRDKIRRAGLQDAVDSIIVSGDFGRGKPHPGIFKHALERLGSRADQTIMVGNSWSSDIEGARSAGIRAIWFNRTPGAKDPPEPVEEIHDLHQLQRCLGS